MRETHLTILMRRLRKTQYCDFQHSEGAKGRARCAYDTILGEHYQEYMYEQLYAV